MSERKAKFKVGQVVAVDTDCPRFHKVVSVRADTDWEDGYFYRLSHDAFGRYSHKLLRRLTKRERGA